MQCTWANFVTKASVPSVPIRREANIDSDDSDSATI